MLILFNLFNNGLILYDSNFQENDQPFNNFLKETNAQNSKDIISNSPQIFTENRGQIDKNEIAYYTQGGEIWFTNNGICFRIKDNIQNWELNLEKFEGYNFNTIDNDQTPIKSVMLEQIFINSNNIRPVGKEILEYKSNFFLGNDSSKWLVDVPNYLEIFYENLYDGIDLRYYSNERGLKYDFVVHPGANISQIRLKYRGAEKLTIDESGN